MSKLTVKLAQIFTAFNIYMTNFKNAKRSTIYK